MIVEALVYRRAELAHPQLLSLSREDLSVVIHRVSDWILERYTSGSHDPEFQTASSDVPYRGPKELLLGVNLTGWVPPSHGFGSLYIEDSNLRGSRLDGANLRRANLTRPDLGNAILVGAGLGEADLEGSSFIAADLTDTDLRGTALSTTRFFQRDPEARPSGRGSRKGTGRARLSSRASRGLGKPPLGAGPLAGPRTHADGSW